MPAQWPPIPPFQPDVRDRVFLGWDASAGYKRCWSEPEDSVGIVGPPRYGKTSGLIIPAVLQWAGSLVSTSTRGDILAFTAAQRRSVAAETGGRLFVYDPFRSEPDHPSMRWSPLAGCDDPAICFRRVAAMTAVAGKGMRDADHWRSGAAIVLRGLFHAAALEDLGLAKVRSWLARQRTEDAAAILRTSGGPAAIWADDLEAVDLLEERERGSFFSTARNTLEATAQPAVLASCATTDLDLDEFLRSRSSLFVIGPSHQQQTVAPLVVGLIESIAHRASELAALDGGRLAVPLLLALDEIANIAPLPSLPSLVSEGGGRRIVTVWAAQSLSQLRARYGDGQQAAILTATTAKLIFGGLSDAGDLHNISSWAGETLHNPVSRHQGPSPATQPRRPSWHARSIVDSGSTPAESRSTNPIYRPALPINDLQQLEPFHAWLFYRSEPPRRVEARPAGTVAEFVRLRGGAQ